MIRHTETGWKVDFRDDKGRRYRREFATEAAARAFESQIKSGKPEPRSLPVLIDEYLSWAEKTGRKRLTTLRRDRNRFGVFLTWCRTVHIDRADQITFDTLSKFQTYFYKNAPFDKARVKQRYKPLNKPANWEKYRQNISAFMNWAVKNRHALDNPCGDGYFKAPSEKKIPPHFKPQELRRVFEYFDNRDMDQAVPYLSIMFRVLAYTGMRFGELYNLKWPDIDFSKNRINIEISKSRTGRSIPIHKDLKPWLKRLPQDTEFVFGNGNGGHLYTNSHVYRQLVEAAAALRIPRRRVHDLRHTFAASLAHAGVSLAEIKKLLGHNDIHSTMQYLVFYDDDLQKAVSKLDF